MTEQAVKQNFTVDCDQGCGQEFTIELKTESLPNRIEKSFFLCPHCGQEYVAYYTDPEIRGMQADIRKLMRRIEQASKHSNYDQDRLAAQHDRLKRQIAKRMKRLKAKY